MKVIKLKNNLTVILSDGSTLTSSNITEENYQKILKEEDEEQVKAIMFPEFYKKVEELTEKKENITRLVESVHRSKVLTMKGASVYIEDVSQLSVPEDLALSICKAEQEGNEELIQTYKNFWTLASLNPDSRARTNLFWFLKKYGMTISKSGLFVAYRNVRLKSEGSNIDSQFARFVSEQYMRVKTKLKKSPKNYFVGLDDNDEYVINADSNKIETVKGNLAEVYSELSNEKKAPVYTDAYSGRFTIKIGEPVTMKRSECDSTQENTCSRGLHVAGRTWLQNNYFGDQSLVVLVNPADVVAVPPSDSYGKMRVCAYYPIALVKRDETTGLIVEEDIPDGFEDDFLDKICYIGKINNEETEQYTLEVPNIPELNLNTVYTNLKNIKLSKQID